MSDDGLVVMKPTSISQTGTSANVNINGGIDFNAVTVLSINGVFTNSYDNYLIQIRATASSGATSNIRLRSSGTDASGSNYAYQYIASSATSVSAGRLTSQTSMPLANIRASSLISACETYIYGPALLQPTAMRSITVDVASSATITDYSSTHSLSTSYDGFTIIPDSGNITGTLYIFGWKQ